MFLIYSATGGADSRPLSPTQLEADAEGAGGVGNGEVPFRLRRNLIEYKFIVLSFYLSLWLLLFIDLY